MRAFVLTGPREFEVQDVEPPVANPGGVIIDVQRVGICGTDVEFYTGEMQYLREGHAHFPLRLGHEWMGTVASVGEDVDPAWIGRRVTGDTMLGCGVCRRCLQGNQHVCEFRFEVGVHCCRRTERATASAARPATTAADRHPGHGGYRRGQVGTGHKSREAPIPRQLRQCVGGLFSPHPRSTKAKTGCGVRGAPNGDIPVTWHPPSRAAFRSPYGRGTATRLIGTRIPAIPPSTERMVPVVDEDIGDAR